MKYIILGLVGAVLAAMLYVRLAPLKADAWHKTDLPSGTAGAFSGPGSHAVVRDVADAQAALVALDGIITGTARTEAVAGSVEEGRVTYVTRSAIWGFPDYTTIAAAPDGGQLLIYGRLRFGKADLGVNRARIDGWLAQLDAAG